MIDLDVRGDNRGWFKENWQRAKMVELGLPDFGPVQNNMSFNTRAGATRGIHAEPWDKLVSLAKGRIFGAWVDLRPGEHFGRSFTLEMGPETAVYVPRGVGNAFQTLEDETAYSYLVNDHWSPAAKDSYTFLNLADETVAIDWPIPLAPGRAVRRRPGPSAAGRGDADGRPPDLDHRGERAAGPGAGRRTARRRRRRPGPSSTWPTRESLAGFDFSPYAVIINAAAYTKVDAAETAEGRRDGLGGQRHRGRAPWSPPPASTAAPWCTSPPTTSSTGRPRSTPRTSRSPRWACTARARPPATPLVATLPAHYILRTSWVIGDGHNFVRTMASLADRGIAPGVVDDQYGRLTFTSEIARAIQHLLRGRRPRTAPTT